MACMEMQASATPTKADVTSTSMGAALYPDWIMRSKTKPMGRDTPWQYRTPKEDAGGGLTLEEELDVASVFDPLQLASQSSQLDTTLGAEGLRTLLHYSNMPATIPPFNLAQVGILPKMSPMTDQENALLNLAQGSPVTHTAPPGLGQVQSRTERSSCSRIPMSLGSPAGTSLTLALKVHTHPNMPAMFGSRQELPRDGDEEEMDATEDDAEEKED